MSTSSILSNEELNRFYQPEVSNDGKLFEIIAPGCPTLDGDKHGYVPFNALTVYLTYGRMGALINKDFTVHSIRGGQYQMFLAYMEYEVSLDFYRDKTYGNAFYPMKFSSWVDSMGKSSMNLVTVIRHGVNNAPLAYSYATLIRVNITEGRSTPIPNDIRKKFNQQTATRRHELPAIDSTTKVFKHVVVGRFSDMDINQHINYASYYNYCLDATSLAVALGRIELFSNDRVPVLVKKLKCSYMKESRDGDNLEVTLWQDAACSTILHFRINKEDGQTSFMCSIEFHKTDNENTTLDQTSPMSPTDWSDFVKPSLTNTSFILSEDDLTRWRQTSVTNEGTSAEMVLPATLQVMINTRGQISPVALIQYVHTGIKTALNNSEFCGHELTPEGCGVFAVQFDCTFEPVFYSTSHRQALGQNVPVRCITQLHAYSRSSVCWKMDMMETKNGNLLSTSYTKHISVDLTSRKSVPISEHLRKRFNQYCDNRKFVEAMPDLQPPNNCFTHSDTVRYTDIDINGHMNLVSYLGLCLDATVSASVKESLGKFSGDGYSRHLKKIRTSYVNECKASETLHIKVWQDDQCSDQLNFRVIKNDGSLSMLCTMDFYSSDSIAKL